EHTAPAGLLKATRKGLGLGKDIEKSARKSLKVFAGPAAFRAAYAAAWTRLYDKGFPWER
ncbi:MAG TPA: hypothetical protein VI915_03525, partial [Thermoplasmata archaeon]|nr:hypothetical protein [Thermoplasmata archaeon]